MNLICVIFSSNQWTKKDHVVYQSKFHQGDKFHQSDEFQQGDGFLQDDKFHWESAYHQGDEFHQDDDFFQGDQSYHSKEFCSSDFLFHNGRVPLKKKIYYQQRFH